MDMTSSKSSRLGCALLDEEGIIRQADDALCAILATERPMLMGIALSHLFPMDPFWQTGETPDIMIESPLLRGMDGWMETAWLKIVIKKSEWQPGYAYLALVEDISEEKAKAHALAEIQQRYSMIIDASLSPLVFLLPNGTLADCNETAARMVNLKKSQLVGNAAWVSLWFRGETDQIMRLSAIITQAREGKTAEVVLPTKDTQGAVRNLKYTILPVRHYGSFTGILIEAHDVTEFEQAMHRAYADAASRLDARQKWLLRNFIHGSDHVAFVNGDGMFMDANPSALSRLGYDLADIRNMRLGDIFHDSDAGRNDGILEKAARHGLASRLVTLRKANGTPYPVVMSLTSIGGEDGPAGRLLAVVFRDGSEQAAKDHRMRMLTAVVDGSPQAIAVADKSGTIQYTNPSFRDMRGFGDQNVQGRLLGYLNPASADTSALTEIREAIASGKHWRGTMRGRKNDGERYQERVTIFPSPNDKGDLAYIIAQAEALTDADTAPDDDAIDHLTGLPSKTAAMGKLHDALKQSRRGKTLTVVMIVDIDSLKTINDALGRKAGDKVIALCGQRIGEIVPAPHVAARLERDQFLIILHPVEAVAEAESLAQRIVATCNMPCKILDQEIFLTARVGIAAYPSDGENVQDLVRKAYVAERQAKEHNGPHYRFYLPSMDEHLQANLRMEALLWRAIEREELHLAYQPVVTARSKQIVGAEALLRWNSHELGPVSPARFIPIAEASGAILGISTWMLNTACRDALAWLNSMWGRFTLSVNFSPRQFDDACLTDTVHDILRAAGFPARSLEIEVTERLLMADSTNILSVVTALKSSGISLSIDDFGTGYSSLSYIRKYPFSKLKIDQSFVADIIHSTESRYVTTAIIDMAHALGMIVTAEGVETAEHEQILSELGCELFQGYRFGKPIPAENFSRLMVQDYCKDRSG